MLLGGPRQFPGIARDPAVGPTPEPGRVLAMDRTSSLSSFTSEDRTSGFPLERASVRTPKKKGRRQKYRIFP